MTSLTLWMEVIQVHVLPRKRKRREEIRKVVVVSMKHHLKTLAEIKAPIQ